MVTGSSRGIGRSTALALANAGADIAVNYLRSAEEAGEVVAEIRALGRRCEAFSADVADAEAIRELVTSVESSLGPISILVNNAGTISRPGSWSEQSDQDSLHEVRTHLLGPMTAIKAVAPGMVARKSGRIINISSTYGLTGAAAVLAYTSAKAALVSLTQAMARELGPHGITVNCVAPGNIDTAMTRSAGEGVIQWVIDTTPVGRLGTPEEIADAIMFLLRSDFITGHTLVVDGGQILNM